MRARSAPFTLLLCLVLAVPTLCCTSNRECDGGRMCIRGRCTEMIKDNSHPMLAGAQLSSDSIVHNESCWKNWPDTSNCVRSWVNYSAGYLMLESNNVPEYFVPAYCPFGIGQGYCQSPTVGNSTDCTPFAGKVCPCIAGEAGCPSNTTAAGDVLVPVYQLFMFPLNPDPTDERKPMHMYNNSALTNGNAYQVIGAMRNGVQIKGPAEANGYNVDLSLIPLPCGGHVTPPVGPGPVYHYHKAADCLEQMQPRRQGHSSQIGHAADGFGIYGYDESAVLDECHGHFGAVDGTGKVEYHYHASGVYNLPGVAHKPYYMGCLGPSKGRCNATVNQQYDSGANWCGQGCGYELCVEPGTHKAQLKGYLDRFAGAGWMKQFTVNPF